MIKNPYHMLICNEGINFFGATTWLRHAGVLTFAVGFAGTYFKRRPVYLLKSGNPGSGPAWTSNECKELRCAWAGKLWNTRSEPLSATYRGIYSENGGHEIKSGKKQGKHHKSKKQTSAKSWAPIPKNFFGRRDFTTTLHHKLALPTLWFGKKIIPLLSIIPL